MGHSKRSKKKLKTSHALYKNKEHISLTATAAGNTKTEPPELVKKLP